MTDFKKTVGKLFNSVDIQINGTRSWDPQINNDLFYARVLSGGGLWRLVRAIWMDGGIVSH